MDIFAVVSFKNFYNQKYPDNWQELIERFPTDLVIMMLSKINATLFLEGGNDQDCQQRIFKEVFQNLESLKRSKVVDIFVKWDKDSNTPIFFSQQSLISLIGLVLENFRHGQDEELVNQNELENILFDTILIANQKYYEEQKEYPLSSYEHLWQLILMQQLYVRDFTRTFESTTLKYFFFFKFIKITFGDSDKYFKEFCDNLGLKGIYNYSGVFLNLITNSFKGYKADNQIKWNIPPDDPGIKIIENFSLRPVDFDKSKNAVQTHRDIIPKPFYFLRDQFPVVVDFNFLWFLMDTGLIYNFYKHTSLNKNGFPDFTSFKALLGKKFYEEFILVNLLKKIFDQKYERVFTEDEEHGLPDILVSQNNRDIYLFEIKSVAVHHQTLEKIDISSFKSFLDDQLIQSKEHGGRNKGIYQLISTLKHLSSDQMLARLGIPSGSQKKVNIYPVIVSLDKNLDLPAVNSYCNDHFDTAVEIWRSSFKKIFPVTIININFFLTHYIYLKKDHALLKTMIKNYHARLESGRKSFSRNNNPMVYFNANASFEIYANSLNLSKNYKPNSDKIIEDFNLLD